MENICQFVLIRHWLPIITFCPVNRLPDLVYISIHFRGPQAPELYGVRRKVRGMVAWRKEFMETLAREVLEAFPQAEAVTLRLAFSRHVVEVRRGME